MNDSKQFKGQIDWVTTLVPFGIVLALAVVFMLLPEQSKMGFWVIHADFIMPSLA